MTALAMRRDDAGDVKRALTDVGRVVLALGLDRGAKRQTGGHGLVICCPAPDHGDRTPSCSVTLAGGTIRVNCFACGLRGDVFHLIAAAEGLTLPRDFSRAVERARAIANMAPAEPRPSARAERAERAEPDGPPKIDPATFAASAAAVLELCPLRSSVAVGLRARGILAEAQRDGWGELPADRPGPFEGDGRSELAAALEALRAMFEPASLRWLFNDRGGLIWSEHRLLIPWRDPAGRVWGLQRRYAPVYGDEAPARAPKYVWPPSHVYDPGPRHAYGVDSPDLDGAKEIWLAEGAADALALRALNRVARAPRSMAALAVPGVATWPAFRASVLTHVRGRVVHVSLDADKAGDEAVALIARDVAAAGARLVDRPKPPAGLKDWAELSARLFGLERRTQ
ncbi:MAG TPA: toprim domain-containing protein [Polyangiaceae bacterium]|nr:toprim domain-containing protein [Polyangiaceae bacterium]